MTPARPLFVAIGNPSPDLDGSIRRANNRWTESIVAIDATTGSSSGAIRKFRMTCGDLDDREPR